MEALLRPGVKHHIYVIGSQECLRPIANSVLYQSKKRWETEIGLVLGSQYVMLRSHTMISTHLAVYVHTSLLPHISNIESEDVCTGLGHLLGNKGAVGISFFLGKTRLLCISCHLAAGQNSVRRRNADLMKIETDLKMVKNEPRPQLLASNQADCTLLLGDLNYRSNASRLETDRLIETKNLSSLLSRDQLLSEMSKNPLFSRYNEAEIAFFPTYRFDLESLRYDTSLKRRIPSWTDRVLYKNATGPYIESVSYNALPLISLSDHKPVVAQFALSFEPVFTVFPNAGNRPRTDRSEDCENQ